MKLCECGCGQPAPLAQKTDRWNGRVKGQPQRFIRSHYGKIGKYGEHHPLWKGGRSVTIRGYVMSRRSEADQKATNKQRILEHVLIAEQALGSPLPIGAVVHHVNEIRSDNRNCNLVICQSDSYHKALHQRLRALRATGSVHSRKCSYCHRWSDPATDQDMHITKWISAHRSCRNAYDNSRRMTRLAKGFKKK